MNETTVHRSNDVLEIRNPIVLHIILIFMGLCLLVAALLAAFAPLPYAENPMFMRIGMGYCGIPFSIALIYLNIHKIIHRRNAIRIDKNGITDNTTSLSSGFTSWDNIAEVFLLRLKAMTTCVQFPLTTTLGTNTFPNASSNLPKQTLTQALHPFASNSKRWETASPPKTALLLSRNSNPRRSLAFASLDINDFGD